MSTIARTAAILAGGAVSPVELVEAALSAIAASQDRLNAVTRDLNLVFTALRACRTFGDHVGQQGKDDTDA